MTDLERARVAAQLLIGMIGSDGPENVEDVAARAVRVMRDLMGDVRNLTRERDSLHARLQFDPGGSDKIDELESAIQHLRHRIEILEEEARALRDRAESAELGCEIAYRREPTHAEGDAHEAGEPDHAKGECFVPMGGWTGRRCRHCHRWTWGGPTVCVPCAERRRTAVRI